MILVLYLAMTIMRDEQNIVFLLPIIVTINTVFVSGFIDLESNGTIISNSVSLYEERKTKSSGLPSSHWCRKCSSDSFYLEDTIQVTPNQLSQLYVKYTYAMVVARKLNFGNILKDLNRPEFS